MNSLSYERRKALLQYLNYHVDLIEMCEKGLGDTLASDLIREDMDVIWNNLSDDEMAILDSTIEALLY